MSRKKSNSRKKKNVMGKEGYDDVYKRLQSNITMIDDSITALQKKRQGYVESMENIAFKEMELNTRNETKN